jgi:hypothetical protein
MWIQLFALMALVAGIFTAHHLLRPGPAPAPAPAAPPSEFSAAPQITAEVPAKPAVTSPKSVGRWVVDPRMGPDADCATLGEALAGARAGDTIVLRPGTYSEGVRITEPVTITGGGVSPDQVIIVHTDLQTIAVTGGPVELDNLSLTNTGLKSYWVITADKARLSLRNVRLRTEGQGVRITDSDFDVSDSGLEGRTALAVSGKSRVNVLRTALIGDELAVSADGGETDLRISNSRILNSRGFGLSARRFSWVRLNEVAITGNVAAAITVDSGAEVRVTSSKITDNLDCGVGLDGGGKIVLDRVLLARNRCGVGFTGPGTLEARDSKFLELTLGAVAVKRGLEKSAVIIGSGNTGLEIPGEHRGGAKR